MVLQRDELAEGIGVQGWAVTNEAIAGVAFWIDLVSKLVEGQVEEIRAFVKPRADGGLGLRFGDGEWWVVTPEGQRVRP